MFSKKRKFEIPLLNAPHPDEKHLKVGTLGSFLFICTSKTKVQDKRLRRLILVRLLVFLLVCQVLIWMLAPSGSCGAGSSENPFICYLESNFIVYWVSWEAYIKKPVLSGNSLLTK